MTTTVLVLVETINEYLPIIESNDFHVILAPTPAERAQAIKAHGGQIKAVLTRGPLGLDAEEIAALFRALGQIARAEGLTEGGYRVLSNCGLNGGQEVPHLHLHLVGGRVLGRMLQPS